MATLSEKIKEAETLAEILDGVSEEGKNVIRAFAQGVKAATKIHLEPEAAAV